MVDEYLKFIKKMWLSLKTTDRPTMRLKGTGVKELKRLEKELQVAIRSTNETIASENEKLHKLRQDYCQAKLRRRQLEYKESLRTPLFS
jgi:hypothetical protein